VPFTPALPLLAALLVSWASPTAAAQAPAAPGGLPRRDGLPPERLPGVEVRLDAVVSGGTRLRTIVTRPAGATARLPAIFVAGWLSCDSTESPPVAQVGDGTGLLLQALAARSGRVLFRVDKPGTGDSEGDCAATDFDQELAAYRAAFRAMRRDPWVDPDRIVVLGLSNGGGFAPLVADGAPVAGYVTSGGWAKTWLEHMLEHERRRLALLGFSPGVISERMRGYAEFYDVYLNGRRTPAEVLRERPYLAPLWYDAGTHQYGRPATFYHQLQGLNLLAAWESVRVPVLALVGEFDWIMSGDDATLVANAVNRHRDGLARVVPMPGMGHSHDVFGSAADAFRFVNPRFDDRLVRVVVEWVDELLGARE
jgi:pimeloyl-ACP methyl ester carboxylesterase